MENTIEGKIISKNLGEFGKNQTVYGYIGIELTNCEHIKVKVDSFTWYQTLEIGTHVFIEVNKLGNTDIMVARRIDVNLHPMNLNSDSKTVCV